jgi:hypothetical protein
MQTNFAVEFLKLIDEIAEDGELSRNEVNQLITWLNNNKDGRRTWPAQEFFSLLKDVTSDGKMDKQEWRQVGRLIQKVRREWAREHAHSDSKSVKEDKVVTTAMFDDANPRLPSIAASIRVASLSEPDVDYLVDFSGPSCTCPDFKSKRSKLPVGHLSRCCKHIIEAYSQVRPSKGWPSWLDSFLENGHFRTHPQQEWAVVNCGGSNFLVSSANPEWGNVYAKIDNENLKYGYSINDDRWSYSDEPQDATKLARAIRKLS